MLSTIGDSPVTNPKEIEIFAKCVATPPPSMGPCQSTPACGEGDQRLRDLTSGAFDTRASTAYVRK